MIVGAVLIFGGASHAQQWTATVNKQLDDQTYIVTINGVSGLWFRGDRVDELFKAENNAKAFSGQLKLCKSDVEAERTKLQNTRVDYGKLETLYNGQSVLFANCMQLSGNGPKWSHNWLLDLGLKIAPTVTSAVRCN